MNSETYYLLALSFLKGMGSVMMQKCLQTYGTAERIFSEGKDEARIAKLLAGKDEALRRAEKELKFCEDHHICILSEQDERYPARLRQCNDRPPLLFWSGRADLNARHALSIVGTRHITEYGKDLCRHFCEDLARLLPDALIVSGLAYGVDIHAHKNAIANHLPTIGVLAHGLDTLYPATHRDTALKMQENGGLLTEYSTDTMPAKGNFVQRNRIVAGMTDTTVVVESAAKGGALITAQMAQDYNRDVFAFPGRIGDRYSEGCNNLVKKNTAALITSAEDFIQAMGWAEASETKSIQRELFPQLDAEEAKIVDALQKNDTLTTGQLVSACALSFNHVNSLLFSLELKGIVKGLPGGLYRLLS